jgi:hypothetical protein
MTQINPGNPLRGKLGFEVEDKQWVFAFTTNALCAIEEAFELDDISQLETIISGKPSLRTIRTLFRIGLTDCHPEMSDHEAGGIMEAVGGLEPSLELIMRAVETAFPEAAKNGTVDPLRTAPKSTGVRGTGRPSTSRGAKQG